MKKGFLNVSLLFSFGFILLLGLATSCDTQKKKGFAAGSGTANDPYLITTIEQLKLLADSVNYGKDFKNVFFRLDNDLIFSKEGEEDSYWNAIGKREHYPFAGSFDGNHKTISNLKAGREFSSLDDFGGLFGVLSESASVSNLFFDETCNVEGKAAGMVAGLNRGNITNCSTKGNVKGYPDGGGIAGQNEGYIFNCLVSGNVWAALSGGITGINSGTIVCCGFKGIVIRQKLVGGGHAIKGGIVGRLESGGTITNCYNRGILEAEENRPNSMGGIIGAMGYYNQDENTIKYCYDAGVGGGAIVHNTIISGRLVFNSYYDAEKKPYGVKSEHGLRHEQGFIRVSSDFLKSNRAVESLNQGNSMYLWVKDDKNINDGYPILKFETEMNN